MTACGLKCNLQQPNPLTLLNEFSVGNSSVTQRLDNGAIGVLANHEPIESSDLLSAINGNRNRHRTSDTSPVVIDCYLVPPLVPDPGERLPFE